MAGLAPPPENLTGFPRRRLPADVDLWRIHRRGVGPWWFSSDGAGRFDLDPPEGTCYLAGSALGAFVEVFRDFRIVAAADVAARSIARLRVADPVSLADCTSAAARQFGVTGAIHTTTDYDVTQAWAAAWRRSGYDGVRYRCGHDPSQREIAVALFGTAGEASFPVAATAPLGDGVIAAAQGRYGLLVLPTPSA